MKIAIIGSGISGLTCAYYLHKEHDITLYEANDYIGGHTATVDVELNGREFAIDTGFIVYNDRTYPNFMALLAEIGVNGVPTEMSFSVKNDNNGLEYNGHTLATLFAQKRNLFRPSFYRFLFEILRFNRLAKAAVAAEPNGEKTLGAFLSEHKFSAAFCDNYILPMGAAIWSSSMADMCAFPLGFFLRFFLNHGLLDVANRPQWYVIEGGSRSYIEPLTKGFKDQIRLNSPVDGVERDAEGVRLTSLGKTETFDQVIFACHSDQALRLLAKPSVDEEAILSQMHYQKNNVILHTDTSLLPKHRGAWASWNYWIAARPSAHQSLPALTYNMNILQHINDTPETFCVSLNCVGKIKPSKILRSFNYHHPVFNQASVSAQQRKAEINGKHNTWFCGAYWRNGFHEDGVCSALDVVKGLATKLEQSASNKGAA